MKNKNYILVGIGIALSLFSSHAAHAKPNQTKPNYITVINEGVHAEIVISIDRMADQDPECWHGIQTEPMNWAPDYDKIILQGNSFTKDGKACQLDVSVVLSEDRFEYREQHEGDFSQDYSYNNLWFTRCPTSKPGDTLVISAKKEFRSTLDPNPDPKIICNKK